MSYVLNSYLLTYLHKYILHLGDALKRFSRPEVKDQGPEQTS